MLTFPTLHFFDRFMRKAGALILLTVALIGCKPPDETAFSSERLTREISKLVELKSSATSTYPDEAAGAWKGKSSPSFLVVSSNGDAVQFIVVGVGKATQTKDGKIQISTPSQGTKSEDFGILKEGKIYRHNYDSMEVFERVSD